MEKETRLGNGMAKEKPGCRTVICTRVNTTMVTDRASGNTCSRDSQASRGAPATLATTRKTGKTGKGHSCILMAPSTKGAGKTICDKASAVITTLMETVIEAIGRTINAMDTVPMFTPVVG